MVHRTDAEIIAAQPEAVDRLLTITREGDAQRTLQTLTQTYRTSVGNLWEACTDPGRLAQWFAPVVGHLRQGGRYEVKDNASGTITACDPEKSFTLTWEYGGDESDVAVTVGKVGHHARLTLDHEHTGPADSEFWKRFGPGAGGVGWELSLLSLALYLESDSDEPRDPAAFEESPAAADFVRAVSPRWAEASIHAGTPEDEAHAAAARTTAFYLGEDVD